MSNEYSDMEFDMDEISETAGSGLPAPAGTHLCRIECEDLAPIGQTLGFKIRGTVVEENYRGHMAEDVLFVTDKAMGRIKLALHRVAGIEHGKLTAAGIKQALDGKLARLTVEKVSYNVKGDSATEYSEAQAAEMRANGTKVYGHAKLAFAGYESVTAEEVVKYGEAAPRQPSASSNGTQAANAKLPF